MLRSGMGGAVRRGQPESCNLGKVSAHEKDDKKVYLQSLFGDDLLFFQ